jgi:hypothetical protein
MKQRAFMKNDFWRIINEKICIRKIILVTFDESDMNNINFRRYEQNCCFHCTKDEEFVVRINLCIRSRLVKSRTKASSYKRKIVKKTLKTWRNRRESNEFIFNYITDDDDYELFLDDNVIKEIIKNVHLMKIVENFLQISMNWSRNWLNKYAEKLIVFVIDVTTNAKKISKRRRVFASSENNFINSLKNNFIENDFMIEDLIIEKINSFEKNNDSSIVFIVFIISFESRIASTSKISRLTRKRHDSLLKNEDSSLRSRNINSAVRDQITEKLMRNQNSNKSRRKLTIKSEIFKKK